MGRIEFTGVIRTAAGMLDMEVPNNQLWGDNEHVAYY